MNTELAKLDEDIAKVKAMIAERKDMYEGVPQPKTQVGWASYIANNDRGMLDKYQDAERAWYNKMKDQEHAQALANAQRQEQADYNRDEWQLNLTKAQNELVAANEALRIATKNGDEEAINAANQAAENAKANVDHWSKRLNVDSNATVYTKQYEHEPKSAKSIIAEAKADFDKNLTQAEIDAHLKALEPYINQDGDAATMYKELQRKHSKEYKAFNAEVLKEAKKGVEDIWDLIDPATKKERIEAARVKLSKGAK